MSSDENESDKNDSDKGNDDADYLNYWHGYSHGHRNGYDKGNIIIAIICANHNKKNLSTMVKCTIKT